MKIGKDLISAVGAENLVKITEGVFEAAIDGVMNDGIAKDIPLIGTFISLASAAGTWRDRRLAEKIEIFLIEVAHLRWSDRSRVVDEIAGTDIKKERLGAEVLELLDKADGLKKPELLAKLFVAVGRGKVNGEDYLRLAGMIAAAPIDDLNALAESHGAGGLQDDRKFILQASGFLAWSIKNPTRGKENSMSKLAEALFDEPFQLEWRLTKDARTILTECFPKPPNRFEEYVSYD
ncbi:hypothetical protein [Lysobacter capsici]|uniref:hypothetical protein n=1 Tax=Lysobacter capsici TaxID=435897 RepID=UPI00044EBA81|nr:hypothetical protein [Lysobacter capsici]